VQSYSSSPQRAGSLCRFTAKNQKSYLTFDRELLAACLAVRNFRFLLEGREFFVETDHKPLTYALHRVSGPWSARQQRQLGFLAEFTADIRHVTGKQNVVEIFTSSPRFGGASIDLQKRPHPPAYGHRRNHTLGGSHSPHGHIHSRLCRCPVYRLGGRIWGAHHHLIRQRSAVCILSVGGNVLKDSLRARLC
jgi:hypothetical protein